MEEEYRELLLEIAQEITRDELATMKFLLLGSALPDFKPDHLGSILVDSFTFFHDLEKKEQLGINNLDRLIYLLAKAKRSDLESRVNNFQTKFKTNATQKSTIPGSAQSASSALIRSVESSIKGNHQQELQIELGPDKDAQINKEMKKRAKKKNYKKRKKAEKMAAGIEVSQKRETVTQDLPVTTKHETETQDLSASQKHETVTQGLPVTKKSETVTQELPMTRKKEMVTQELPVTRKKEMVTQGLPVMKKSDTVTQGLPVTRKKELVPQELPVRKTRETVTQELPVTRKKEMVTQELPVRKTRETVTQELPVTRKKEMVTQELPVRKTRVTVTQELPMTRKREMVTQELPVRKTRETVTQELPVTRKKEMVTQELPVRKTRVTVTQELPVTRKKEMVTQELPVRKTRETVTQELPMTRKREMVTQELPVRKTRETVTQELPVTRKKEMVTQELPVRKTSETVTQGLPVTRKKEMVTQELPVRKTRETVTQELPVTKTGETVTQELPVTRKKEMVTQGLPVGKKNEKVKTESKDRIDGKRSPFNKDFSDEDTFHQMRVLTLCNKWQSWGESVPVINRELCLALARAGHTVACLVLKSTDFEKEEARKGNVELIQCSDNPGIKSDDLQLVYHDQELPFSPDLVIGHGKLTGPASVFHAKKSSCPRLHVIHDLPSEWPKLDNIVVQECDEENLARSADFVAVIGTLLKEQWSTIINRDVIELIPGLPQLIITRNTISSPQCRCLVPAKFCSPDASGLRIAVMAVNYSSKREKPPRKATFIACNTDSSYSLKPARKILKECDKKTVDLKERTGINCQETYLEIQGATVFLSPARVEAFGVAALDAMAIGIPIFISAQSGLAYTIREHLNAKFHSCIIDVTNACHSEQEDDEDKDARIWSISLDKISLNREQAFSLANDLRSEWNEKFSWDAAVQNLTHVIARSGKLPSRSPSLPPNSVVAKGIPESCLDLVKELNLFDKRLKFVLFLSPEDPQFLQNAVHLGLVHWAAVFDFDRESVTTGYLNSCLTFLENIGKPACRLLPPPKEDVTMENYNLSLPNGIPWILLQGIPDMERDVEGNYGWVQEILSLLKKKHPGAITILVIWKSIDNKCLIKRLCKILTKIQTDRAWENSVNLEVLSTSEAIDSRLENFAEDWSISIKRVKLSHLFDAIYSTAIANPLNQIDPDFSLPKRSNANGETTSEALPPSSRWVDSVLEVLYTSVGNTPEFGQDDAHHFYRGGKISWYGIEMNYAVERQSWERLKKSIKEELEYPGAAFLTLSHQRGAGGTTSARNLVYDFHLRYPCVCLKTINYETFLAIKVIWEFCSLPVIILADINEAPGAEDNDIESLYGNLSNDKVSCLILHIVHRHYQGDKRREKVSSSKETAVLAEPLTDTERVKFIEVYSLQNPKKKPELGKMRYEDEKLQIPFYYGIVAFEDQFQGLKSFVSACLHGLDDAQRKALCFLTMAFQYGRKELPLSALAGIFRLKPRQLHDIEDILTQDAIDLLIEEYGRWRPRHCTIGEEMLCQLLTEPYGISYGNWQLNLADKTIEFVAYMEEDVTKDVLLNRISDEKTYKRFSTLVEHIPDRKDVVRVFEKAISVHPENPFLRAHLGRYYSVREGSQGFDTALRYTDESILLASKMSRNVRGQLTQMRGMIYKRQVKNQIESDEATFDDIFSLAQEGVNAFTRAAGINPDKAEDSYIPQVRMMCDIFKYIDRAFQGGIFSYLKSKEAHAFILEGFSETSDILESVSDSNDYPYLRRDLFRIGVRGNPGKPGDKEDLIKHFQEVKRRRKTSIASINRLIVLLHLELCKEKQKPVSKIAPLLMNLLEEALKYDQNNDNTMRIWTKVAPHIPIDLMAAESKIASWCNQGKSVLSYLYRYIFSCIRIIEGGKDQKFEDDREIAEDELLKSVRAATRVALRHPDRPVVFLGKGKGMGQLATLERESFKEVRKQRMISDTTELRRMTGIITRTGKVGQIKTDHGLIISFRADLCQPTPLLGESYLSRKVCFYLAFTYFGADAYNVRIIPG